MPRTTHPDARVPHINRGDNMKRLNSSRAIGATLTITAIILATIAAMDRNVLAAVSLAVNTVVLLNHCQETE